GRADLPVHLVQQARGLLLTTPCYIAAAHGFLESPPSRGLPSAGRALWAPDRVAAIDDPVDQVGHGRMHLPPPIFARIVRMSRRGIAQDADDLALRQDVSIIESEQKRFAD